MIPADIQRAIEAGLRDFENEWRRRYWARMREPERSEVLAQQLASCRAEIEADARAHLRPEHRRRRRLDAAHRWLHERDEADEDR